MRVLLFENPQAVTEDAFQKDLSFLPKWRKDRVLEYRFLLDRVLCTKAYLLLKEALRLEYGILGNPSFAYQTNGKPLLKDYPEIFFNMSHCREGVLCVVADWEVGCDIEEIPNDLDLDSYAQCLNAEEEDRVLHAPEPNREFIQIWTRKEAVLKYTGEGICDDLKKVLAKDQISNLRFQTWHRKKFIYTICHEKRKR